MPEITLRKSAAMYRLEEQHGQRIELVVGEAIESSASLVEAAAKLGISYITLWHWMRMLGIEATRRHVIIGAETLREPS